MNNGIAVIFSGPSGVGKSSLCKELFKRFPGMRFSVSCTTRQPRPGEVDGVSYHFISKESFEQHLAANDFLESAEVHGNYYGTLKAEVLPIIQNDGAVLLDIDVQGARKIWKNIEGHEIARSFVSVFIAPPSMEELEKRLRGRNTETEEAIEKRLYNARVEMAAKDEYEFCVVNNELERAVDELEAIIRKAQQC